MKDIATTYLWFRQRSSKLFVFMNKVSYDNLKGIEQKNGTMSPVNHLSDLMYKICSKYF